MTAEPISDEDLIVIRANVEDARKHGHWIDQDAWDGVLARLDRAEADNKEMQHTFDLRWEADMRAIKRWQQKTGKELIWPDHADLVVWLLSCLERGDTDVIIPST